MNTPARLQDNKDVRRCMVSVSGFVEVAIPMPTNHLSIGTIGPTTGASDTN